jgi:hypothetical protein
MPDRRRQRIRDPLHNLIEFNEDDDLERKLWRVVNSAPFQRLRRIRQLGFSDFVFPGATHSRFAHSVGVFHTARRLEAIIRRDLGGREFEPRQMNAALAAALLHDVGHGPFSHAFEPLGELLDSALVGDHETHSEALIRSGEIGEILDQNDRGFADLVASVVHGGPATVYRSVVSSQFDADRLDYVRRDRLMTGTGLAAIDFEWLMANLEIGDVESAPGLRRPTFVLGPKSIHAAEGFVTGLFQMYPNVYFHKTTRGAEKLMQAMLRRAVELALDGRLDHTGLTRTHPLAKLFREPGSISSLAQIDDFVVLGSLPVLSGARDPLIRDFAGRLMNRRLFKAIDLLLRIRAQLRLAPQDELPEAVFLRTKATVRAGVDAWCADGREGRVLLDEASRTAYKKIEAEGPMNQIWIREGTHLVELNRRSAPVDAIQPYRLFRAYVAEDDEEARQAILDIVREAVEGGENAEAT